MSTLEIVVRPFQSPTVSYPTRIFDATAKQSDDVTLELGKEGSTKTFQESFNENISTYRDQQAKEQSRKTHQKRVTNPDDASQFVDVEVIDKLQLKSGSGRRFQRTDYSFNND